MTNRQNLKQLPIKHMINHLHSLVKLSRTKIIKIIKKIIDNHISLWGECLSDLLVVLFPTNLLLLRSAQEPNNKAKSKICRCQPFSRNLCVPIYTQRDRAKNIIFVFHFFYLLFSKKKFLNIYNSNQKLSK